MKSWIWASLADGGQTFCKIRRTRAVIPLLIVRDAPLPRPLCMICPESLGGFGGVAVWDLHWAVSSAFWRRNSSLWSSIRLGRSLGACIVWGVSQCSHTWIGQHHVLPSIHSNRNQKSWSDSTACTHQWNPFLCRVPWIMYWQSKHRAEYETSQTQLSVHLPKVESHNSEDPWVPCPLPWSGQLVNPQSDFCGTIECFRQHGGKESHTPC